MAQWHQLSILKICLTCDFQVALFIDPRCQHGLLPLMYQGTLPVLRWSASTLYLLPTKGSRSRKWRAFSLPAGRERPRPRLPWIQRIQCRQTPFAMVSDRLGVFHGVDCQSNSPFDSILGSRGFARMQRPRAQCKVQGPRHLWTNMPSALPDTCLGSYSIIVALGDGRIELSIRNTSIVSLPVKL